MSILVDRTIKKILLTAGPLITHGVDGDPVNTDQIQPASVDVHLEHLLYEEWEEARMVGGQPFPPKLLSTKKVSRWALQPNEFILGTTAESVRIPSNMCAVVEGKSSLGRLGLKIQNAGFIDPGFNGQITLELKNEHHARWQELIAGQLIAQVRFMWCDQPAEKPYGHPDRDSHYQGQMGATPSWLA